MASIVPTALAALRMAAGTSLLCSPEFTAKAFLLPFDAMTSTIGGRMTGARDLALGALLYASRPRRTSQDYNPALPREQAPLLKDDEPPVTPGSDGFRQALIAGLLVDGLDVISALVGYFGGTLPIEGLGTLGGGALLFFAMGAFSLYRYGY